MRGKRTRAVALHDELAAGRKAGFRTAREAAVEVKRLVVGQDGAVEAICEGVAMMAARARAVAAGVDRDDLPRCSSILVVGPSGSGKTYAVRQVAKAFGLPSLVVDASAVTGEGWRGDSVSTRVRDASRLAGESETGVCLVVWDEVDKMALKGNDREKSFDPQPNLLKVLDGGEVAFYDRDGEVSGRYDADRLIHVLSGAFTGIEDVAPSMRRVPGFSAGGAQEARVEGLSTEDFEAWGMSRELLGRVGMVVRMPALGAADLELVVKGGPRSLEARFGRLMPPGSSFGVSDAAARHIARRAAASGLGARACERELSKVAARCLADAAPGSRYSFAVLLGTDGVMMVRRDERPLLPSGGYTGRS